MLNLEVLQKELNSNKIRNCYVLCSIDLKLISDIVNKIKQISLDGQFEQLNYIKLDGSKIEDIGVIKNACETLPFMSKKRIIEIYNAEFLKGDTSSKLLNDILKYIDNLPNHSVLIMYYTFEDDLEKPKKNFKKFEYKACTAKLDKLRGLSLENKVKKLFDERKKNIKKSDIKFFCSQVDNNVTIMENEIEKLCAYTYGRDITRQDIIDIMPVKSENNIFNLVDFLAQKKLNKAYDILNELIWRGKKETYILYMIERQYKLITIIKKGLACGLTKDNMKNVMKRKFHVHPYSFEKMLKQSELYSEEKLEKILDKCIKSEKKLKITSTDMKTELEILIMDIMIA